MSRIKVGPRPGHHSRTEDTDSTQTTNGHATVDARQHTSPDAATPGTALVWVPCARPWPPRDIPSQLERRRRASKRSPRLDCGCPDPWVCRCYDTGELSDVMVEAVVSALHHLDDLGVPGILDIHTCRSLWRQGHRQLAADVAARGGWSV